MPKDSRILEGSVITRKKINSKEPPLYRAILLNDDYTTMEFVVSILVQVFRKSEAEANNIMIEIHNQGAGEAGIFSREIAETKAALVHQLAKENEFPLHCIIEAV